MTNQAGKGLEFAADLAKQVITIATGTLALTVTFAEKFDSDGLPPIAVPYSMIVAWIFYVASIMGAILLMMAAAGSANALANGDLKAGNIMNANTKWPAIVMIAAFFVALVATAYAGWQLGRR
jgi:hypothetical protein